ncbi:MULTISPECIES: response regulator [unclassified Rhizobium]|uniref:response regulator n=1 Tax=unclassified Rhizobium TaxID=2613769 RepID=UPI00161EF4AF|nr:MULTISPECIES: response regulator [unclassified Rhizobium]MBB3543299.1 CheY-like chemotaxis protein [Rhizobium sp. BK399]MCS3741688.1 CheY-like chemotaxis protein [Rhizobium sp. BK661]MCS4093589.1 CheY-like chemotaxis protein [Rhizobium sp. BK176]
MNDNREEWIAARAYALWEQAEKPLWQDQAHWQQAVLERDLLEQTRASADGQEVMSRVRSARSRGTDASSILVVEDEHFLRFETVDVLEQAGYRVLEAANADEALVLLKTNCVNTLFTDIDMPGTMDGLGLVKTVRSKWPSTKLIVTSGLIKLSHRDLESGVHFIAKPAPSRELLKLIV